MKRFLPFLLTLLSLRGAAQNQLDTLSRELAEVKRKQTALDWLKKFNLSAYVQMQYQHADTVGIKSYAGGDFPAQSSDRFRIRRGRVKLEFANQNKKGVVNYYATAQINFNETGVNFIEAWGKIVDPWLNTFALSGGMMNRPFGFEVGYSSRTRETPERGRMSQILFPNERDLGFMLTIEPPKYMKKASFFKINAGIYNGTGLPNNEIDKRKDFIGQIVLHKEFLDSKIKLSGGTSYYYGGVLQSTSNFYSFGKDTLDGALRYQKHTDTTSLNKRFFKREYIGFDVQLTANYKIGSTTLRGEYIFGTEPGQATSDGTPLTLGNDIYTRKFNGLYAYLVQTFTHQVKGQSISHDLVLKYDWFDPNTQVKGKDLSTLNDAKAGIADVKFQTIGAGYVFRPADYVKLMLYYDLVLNEKTNLTGFTNDIHDNVFTLRTQFTFDSKWFNK
ncbi:MAG: porin [Chitinophagales bacterium]